MLSKCLYVYLNVVASNHSRTNQIETYYSKSYGNKNNTFNSFHHRPLQIARTTDLWGNEFDHNVSYFIHHLTFLSTWMFVSFLYFVVKCILNFFFVVIDIIYIIYWKLSLVQEFFIFFFFLYLVLPRNIIFIFTFYYARIIY